MVFYFSILFSASSHEVHHLSLNYLWVGKRRAIYAELFCTHQQLTFAFASILIEFVVVRNHPIVQLGLKIIHLMVNWFPLFPFQHVVYRVVLIRTICLCVFFKFFFFFSVLLCVTNSSATTHRPPHPFKSHIDLLDSHFFSL